jgi:hypothetical protein
MYTKIVLVRQFPRLIMPSLKKHGIIAVLLRQALFNQLELRIFTCMNYITRAALKRVLTM